MAFVAKEVLELVFAKSNVSKLLINILHLLLYLVEFSMAKVLADNSDVLWRHPLRLVQLFLLENASYIYLIINWSQQ